MSPSKKAKRKAGERTEAPTPLTESQLTRALKPRRARASAKGLFAEVDVLLAAAGRPRVEARSSRLATQKGAVRLRMRMRGAEIGARVFAPSIPGQRLALPRLTAESEAHARLGLPDLDGYLPPHLPLKPVPPRLARGLEVRRYLGAGTKRLARDQALATTIFSPDNRYTFSDTSFPWCTIGRVDTAGGVASGVMVGPRHLLTVSHAMVWQAGSSAGWVQFRPSYFDGSAPFGEAWATRWYAYRKAVGPGLSRAEIREDYVVLVLDRRIGDLTGWMGSRTYADSWDGSGYWRHIGYPGDLAALQRPSYERDIALDGSSADSDSHKRAFHQGDVWPGQSGGPFFAWWTGEDWPRVVAVQSAHNPSTNLAAAGSRLVNLIIQARSDFP